MTGPWKPTPPHNPLKAPATCMCIDCCAVIAAKRCTATNPEGIRCGDYKGQSSHLIDDWLHDPVGSASEAQR